MAKACASRPGPLGKSDQVFGAVNFDRASVSALTFPAPESGSRARIRTDPARPSVSAGDVEAMVISVDEVNVGMAGRPEQHRGAGSISGGGVSRGILPRRRSRFDFDDASRQTRSIRLPHQYLAQQFTRDPAWIAGEEGPRDGTDEHRWCRVRWLSHAGKS